jgi:hypothetical protein
MYQRFKATSPWSQTVAIDIFSLLNVQFSCKNCVTVSVQYFRLSLCHDSRYAPTLAMPRATPAAPAAIAAATPHPATATGTATAPAPLAEAVATAAVSFLQPQHVNCFCIMLYHSKKY